LNIKENRLAIKARVENLLTETGLTKAEMGFRIRRDMVTLRSWLEGTRDLTVETLQELCQHNIVPTARNIIFNYFFYQHLAPIEQVRFDILPRAIRQTIKPAPYVLNVGNYLIQSATNEFLRVNIFLPALYQVSLI